MTELFAGFTQSFADAALASQTYPLTRRIEPRFASLSDGDDDCEILDPRGDVDADVETRDDWGRNDEGEALVDMTIEGFLAALVVSNAGRESLLDSAEKDLIALYREPIGDEMVELADGSDKKIMDLTSADLAALEAAGDRKAVAGLGRLWRTIKAAVKNVARIFVRNLKQFMAKYFRFTVQWAELTVMKRPTATVTNPIELKKLDLRVQVMIEACVKLGRWRCAQLTTPKIAFSAGSLAFTPEVRGPLVIGSARVENFDFVASISIFGFSFKISIGLTKIVNKVLADRPPEVLLDISRMSYPLPMLNTKFVPSGIGISSGKDYLEADVSGHFLPI